MRLTTDTPKNNLEMALNLFYVKDEDVWVRGYGKNGADISLLDLTREILSYQCPYVESDISDDDLIEMMPEWLFDDVRSTEHVVGLLYQAAWVCAELREDLKQFEDKEDAEDSPVEYTEIWALYHFCVDLGIKCTIERLYDGYAVRFPDGSDFAQHHGTYGGTEGCVEPAIGDSEFDYTAVGLNLAKELVKKHKANWRPTMPDEYISREAALQEMEDKKDG